MLPILGVPAWLSSGAGTGMLELRRAFSVRPIGAR